MLPRFRLPGAPWGKFRRELLPRPAGWAVCPAADWAVFSQAVMGLLRDEIGFSGVIVSDDLGATAAVADVAPADRALRFIDAGGDLIISKNLPPAIAIHSPRSRFCGFTAG